MIKDIRNRLKEQNKLIEESFELSKLFPSKSTYKNIHYKRIIFCEGIEAKNNPYFNYLPFIGSKGEVLFLENKFPLDHIYKRKIFACQFNNKSLWLGSFYRNEFQDDLPSQGGFRKLNDMAENIFHKIPKIIDHKAAIRPTNRDRRPYIGPHPKWSNMYIFNGLGAKGSSLGPYFGNMLINNINSGKKIDMQVNINRIPH